VNALLLAHPWLRHHAGVYNAPPANAAAVAALPGVQAGPAIFEFLQEITVTASNRPLTVVDNGAYFNH
jgi:hypothetical protein